MPPLPDVLVSLLRDLHTPTSAAETALRNNRHVAYLRRRPEDLQKVLQAITAAHFPVNQACRVVSDLVHELGVDLHAVIQLDGHGLTAPGEFALLNPRLLKHMVSLGLQVNARISEVGELGESLLHRAVKVWMDTADSDMPSWCFKQLLESVQVLLDAGANPNIQTAQGMCPLKQAIGQLQKRSCQDLRIISALLPVTTCMPLCDGLSSKDLVREMQRPAASVVADLLKLFQRSGQDSIPLSPSPKLDLLLTAVQFRLPSFDTLLTLLPWVGHDRYVGWVSEAAVYCSEPAHRPGVHLVAKYKAALIAQPGCISLYAWLEVDPPTGTPTSGGILLRKVLRDAACRAVLPQGLKAFLAKLSTSHELTPAAVQRTTRLFSQLITMTLIEAGVALCTGGHPWIAPFSDADHWRDILQLLCLKGVDRDLDILLYLCLPCLLVLVLYSPGGRLSVVPHFLEELTGPSRRVLDLMAKQLRKLIRDASEGQHISVTNLRIARCVCEIMAACRRVECLGLPGCGGVEELGPVIGVQDQDLPGYVQRMQERMREPMAVLRASELWKHMQQLHGMPEAPACISPACLGTTALAIGWVQLQCDLAVALDAVQPQSLSYRLVQALCVYYLVRHLLLEQVSVSGTTSSRAAGTAFDSAFRRKFNADVQAHKAQVQARRLQTCSNCQRAEVELESLAASGLAPGLSKCSGCRAASYCSRECQLAHWKAGHNQECKQLAAQRQAGEAATQPPSSGGLIGPAKEDE